MNRISTILISAAFGVTAGISAYSWWGEPSCYIVSGFVGFISAIILQLADRKDGGDEQKRR